LPLRRGLPPWLGEQRRTGRQEVQPIERPEIASEPLFAVAALDEFAPHRPDDRPSTSIALLIAILVHRLELPGEALDQTLEW
jgi:hypothetical protein